MSETGSRSNRRRAGAARKAAFGVCVFVVALLVIYTGLLIYLNSSAGSFPTDGPYPKPAITRIAWPTIGYPALVEPGGRLEVEMNVGGRTRVDALNARLVPARKELAGLEYRLSLGGARVGASRHWPAGTRFGGRKDIVCMTLEVPPEAVPELYDLEIDGTWYGERYGDVQAHSVSVVEPDDGDCEFLTLADVHVHERDISGWMQPQSNKGVAPDGRPVYFERAIDQVNLRRPDFVVLLGDMVRAQRYPGEYQQEFDWFYRTLMRFEVPIFAVVGNHDSYVNEVNGKRVWEENLGPLHYSFDYEGGHYSAVDTTEWPVDERVVMKKLGTFVYPRKWQGQVLMASNESDPATYRGQLAWLRDDLAAHRDSRTRIVFLHHDPYIPDGAGISFDNELFAGVFPLGGGGMGRGALRELASRYRVDMVMSGHLHRDNVGGVPWKGGGGKTTYAGQAMVYYDRGAELPCYPCYRVVRVTKGVPGDYTYMGPAHSIPLYDGSRLEGDNDLNHLDRPALTENELSGPYGVTLENYLGAVAGLEGVVVAVPRAAGGYLVEGGTAYRVVDIPVKGLSVFYIRVSMPPGVPGRSPTKPGTPSRTTVRLSPR